MENFLKDFLPRLIGLQLEGPVSASIMDIFGAVFIDPVAREGWVVLLFK